jgi:hypothetical protein
MAHEIVLQAEAGTQCVYSQLDEREPGWYKHEPGRLNKDVKASRHGECTACTRVLEFDATQCNLPSGRVCQLVVFNSQKMQQRIERRR